MQLVGFTIVLTRFICYILTALGGTNSLNGVDESLRKKSFPMHARHCLIDQSINYLCNAFIKNIVIGIIRIVTRI